MYNKNGFNRKLLEATIAVKQYFDEHLPSEWKNAEAFAREMQINREDLQKCFYVKYGKKISEYQQERRIEVACAMLDDGEMSIKEIAGECGYSNQNNFSYAFKKQKNMTPTEWQLKNENGIE